MSDPAEQTTATAALPAPADRPDADVIVYDGHCRICTAQVRRLARFDRRGRLAFISLHDPEVARRWPELSHDDLMQDMYVVDGRGRKHRGAAAIRYLSRRLWRLWWLAPLLHIPFSLPLWQWLYRQVADRRYLFGKVNECHDGACSVHFGPKAGK
jgi:predicted DCC family thiol-disulfide oxidoreductase YuxK